MLTGIDYSVLHDFQTCFVSHIDSRMNGSLAVQSALHEYMESINWGMRDHRIVCYAVTNRMAGVDKWLERVFIK